MLVHPEFKSKTRRFTLDLHRDTSILNQKIVEESTEMSHTLIEDHQFTPGWVLSEIPTPVNMIELTVKYKVPVYLLGYNQITTSVDQVRFTIQRLSTIMI